MTTAARRVASDLTPPHPLGAYGPVSRSRVSSTFVLCRETSRVPMCARQSQECTRLVPARNLNFAIAGNKTSPFAGLSCKHSDGLEPSTPPYHGGFGASRAYMRTRDTLSPANRAVACGRDASRDVARVVSNRQQSRSMPSPLRARRGLPRLGQGLGFRKPRGAALAEGEVRHTVLKTPQLAWLRIASSTVSAATPARACVAGTPVATATSASRQAAASILAIGVRPRSRGCGLPRRRS